MSPRRINTFPELHRRFLCTHLKPLATPPPACPEQITFLVLHASFDEFHTLRNLISQDETPTASTTPQKSMLSLSDNHFLSVLKFHLLLNYTILVQLLALSPCYHPSEARPERRSLDNVNMFNIYGEEATSFSCFCTFGL
ncbi:hypothetical protein MANES_13G077278v8 [Manihot esculenta]|uniref:Uncharacterized protein n=1 Tax=Manihot esculenta TaxID=3983 RepID=A0ACB7GKP3_MANES|nr:hypothetical protein MANES_13G077278v8 [Manihot esculenta]